MKINTHIISNNTFNKKYYKKQ